MQVSQYFGFLIWENFKCRSLPKVVNRSHCVVVILLERALHSPYHIYCFKFWRGIFLKSSQPVAGTGHWALGTGHWALGTEHWALSTEHWALSTEHWALSTEHWALSTEHWALSTEHWALSTEHWALSTEHWALSTEDLRQCIMAGETSTHNREFLFWRYTLRNP
jgi:hypothetical protein